MQKQIDNQKKIGEKLVHKFGINEINEFMFKDKDSEEKIELKRKEAYSERKTRKLLQNLLEKGKKAEIIPIYDPSYGFRYKKVEEYFNDDTTPDKVKD